MWEIGGEGGGCAARAVPERKIRGVFRAGRRGEGGGGQSRKKKIRGSSAEKKRERKRKGSFQRCVKREPSGLASEGWCVVWCVGWCGVKSVQKVGVRCVCVGGGGKKEERKEAKNAKGGALEREAECGVGCLREKQRVV